MTTKTDKDLIRSTPCDNCPFRAKYKDEDYLRPGRRSEILRSLRTGGFFPCHKTTEYEDHEDGSSDMVHGASTVECAGSTLMLLRDNDAPFIVRLQDADKTRAFIERNADVELWTVADVRADNRPSYDEDDEFEPCNTVNEGCLAPAGFLVGGEVEHGTESADLECPGCGEPVCSECADDDGLCGTCTEDDDDD